MATNLLAQIERLWANLRGLGVRRLSALALIGVAVFATTGLAGYYLSRPTMETLYSGLDRDDIAAIGAALREAGVPFDVNAESTVVLTPAGQAAAARMILAEKGLPRGGAIGNELYDKLGSLGLDVVHAGRYAFKSARRRTRAHDPDDADREGRTGAHCPRR